MIFHMNGGGKKIEGTATPAKVLAGDTFMSAASKDVQEGTMPNNGAVSQALNAGGSYTIPAGYHNGSGKVTANSLASQTDGDAAAADISNGKIAWVDGVKVTGSMPSVEQATPAINISSAGLITASATQSAGKVAAGTKSSTKQLTTQAAKTVTPSNAEQTAAASGVFTTGAVKVAAVQGDATAADVAKGKTFQSAGAAGVQTGTKVPQGTATPEQVLSGYTFESANSEELQTGTMTRESLFKSATVTVVSVSSNTSSNTYSCTFTAAPGYICGIVGKGNTFYLRIINTVGSFGNEGSTYHSARASYSSNRTVATVTVAEWYGTAAAFTVGQTFTVYYLG